MIRLKIKGNQSNQRRSRDRMSEEKKEILIKKIGFAIDTWKKQKWDGNVIIEEVEILKKHIEAIINDETL